MIVQFGFCHYGSYRAARFIELFSNSSDFFLLLVLVISPLRFFCQSLLMFWIAKSLVIIFADMVAKCFGQFLIFLSAEMLRNIL